MYFPDIALLIGRIIAGGFFLMNGVNHFAKLDVMAGYAKSKGTFAPALSVGGTGVILLLGGASLLLGYHTTIGAALSVDFLLGVSFSIHNFWALQEPHAKTTEMVNFMKNMGLLGLVLMTVAIPRPWPMSLAQRAARYNGDFLLLRPGGQNPPKPMATPIPVYELWYFCESRASIPLSLPKIYLCPP